MPERSFGRTVRYRRTKLGLSQAQLAELVGRSPSTVRSWERDQSVPSDDKVLTALSAILGVDERMLFDKAGQSVPELGTSPTIEQALATLDPELAEETAFGQAQTLVEPDEGETEPEVDMVVEIKHDPEEAQESTPLDSAAYAAPPAPYVVTAASPPAHEPSYMEDSSQRQLYRVRNLATIVVLVALGIAFLWALSEGMGALGDWWDNFFGNLRL